MQVCIILSLKFQPQSADFLPNGECSPHHIFLSKHTTALGRLNDIFSHKGYTLCRMLHGTTINIKSIFSVPQTAPSIGRANYLNSEQNQARLDQ